MIAHDELKAALDGWGAEDVTDKPDRPNSISSVVIRARYEGRLTVAVGSDASTEECIGAVLDLLDLHAFGGHSFAGRPVAADEVSVVLGARADSEALDAIGTLLATLQGAPAVRVHIANKAGMRPAATLAAADFSSSEKAIRYLELMNRLQEGPPPLLRDVQKSVDRQELRAYPMLTANPWWSLRLEGLEVGRFRPDRGWLDVGKVGRTGKEGEARTVWRTAVENTLGKQLDDAALHLAVNDASVNLAESAVTRFAEEWLGRSAPEVVVRQNEHALESRILRGACPVEVASGRLHLLQADDGVTNWGSQFPTRWGHGIGNAARYLDALMRQGDVPWAVEMKVQGGTGVGGYYRHAVGQAVLYRHFIRSAAALNPWFEQRGLERTAVRAAVVVPALDARPEWRHRLRTVCDLVDVELVEVAHEYAALR